MRRKFLVVMKWVISLLAVGLLVTAVVVVYDKYVRYHEKQLAQERTNEHICEQNAQAGWAYAEGWLVHHDNYPTGIAKEMNSRANIINPYGGDAFEDIPSSCIVGNAPGVCYYEYDDSRICCSWFIITVYGKDGKHITTLVNKLFHSDPTTVAK